MAAVLLTILLTYFTVCNGVTSSYSDAPQEATYDLKKAKHDDPVPYPLQISMTNSGHILVIDVILKRMRIFDSDLNNEIGMPLDVCGSDVEPRGMAVTSEDDIIVVCGNGYRRLSLTVDGIDSIMEVNEAGSGPRQFFRPEGVAVDFPTGNIYIADYENYRVQVLGPYGDFIRQFGKDDFTSKPCYISVSNDGRVAISDVDGSLYIYKIDGTFMRKMTSGKEIKMARDVAFDNDGHLFIADIAGRIVILDKNYDNIGVVADLLEPRGVSVSANGDILVTEIAGKKLRKYKKANIKTEL